MNTMIARLFQRTVKQTPQFDIEKAVGHYLLTLSRCTASVAAVSRSYLDKRFNCELTVDAVDLASWLDSHTFLQDGAAGKAFLLWLRGADRSDESISYIHESFFAVIEPYSQDLLQLHSAKVHCPECGQVVAKVSEQTTDLPRDGIYERRRFEWICPSGHVLYRDEWGMHVHKSKIEVPEFLRKL